MVKEKKTSENPQGVQHVTMLGYDAPFKDSRVGGEANIPSVPAYHGHTPALGHQEDSHTLTGQREAPRPQDLRLLLTPGCCFDNSFFYETFVINKL